MMDFSKYAMALKAIHQPHACLCSASDQYAFSNAAAKPGKVIAFFSKLTGLPQTALL